jgi:hypothetical protein
MTNENTVPSYIPLEDQPHVKHLVLALRRIANVDMDTSGMLAEEAYWHIRTELIRAQTIASDVLAVVKALGASDE